MSSDESVRTLDWRAIAAADEAKRTRERFDKRLSGEYQSPPDLPTADFLAAIRGEADRARALFAVTACEGYSENLARCTWTVERSCPERKSSGCPRRIAEWEESRRSCQPDTATVWRGWGVPGVAAAQIARGEVQSTEALELVEAWWAKKPRPKILALLGDNDSGKTFAACVLLTRFSGRFVSTQEIANRCREESWLRSLLTPGLVVVDELGGEAGFPDGRAAVGRILSQRIDAGVFTIATGNIDAPAIAGWYDERLADRIRKLGQVEGVEEIGLRGTP